MYMHIYIFIYVVEFHVLHAQVLGVMHLAQMIRTGPPEVLGRFWAGFRRIWKGFRVIILLRPPPIYIYIYIYIGGGDSRCFGFWRLQSWETGMKVFALGIS